MATLAQVSLEQYLGTSYEPDVDFVDGKLEERFAGEFDHSILQQEIAFWFRVHARDWDIRAVIEQRTRMAATRGRVPDVSVFARSTPIEQVFKRPQLIAIEVPSPEDRRSRTDKKIQNYIDFGVPNIWVVDPAKRIGWDCSDGGWTQAARFVVADSPIYLSLPELFAKIDEDLAN